MCFPWNLKGIDSKIKLVAHHCNVWAPILYVDCSLIFSAALLTYTGIYCNTTHHQCTTVALFLEKIDLSFYYQ